MRSFDSVDRIEEICFTRAWRGAANVNGCDRALLAYDHGAPRGPSRFGEVSDLDSVHIRDESVFGHRFRLGFAFYTDAKLNAVITRILENAPLAPLTTFGIGGPARYFIEATSETDVVDALHFA